MTGTGQWQFEPAVEADLAAELRRRSTPGAVTSTRLGTISDSDREYCLRSLLDLDSATGHLPPQGQHCKFSTDQQLLGMMPSILW